MYVLLLLLQICSNIFYGKRSLLLHLNCLLKQWQYSLLSSVLILFTNPFSWTAEFLSVGDPRVGAAASRWRPWDREDPREGMKSQENPFALSDWKCCAR